MKQVRAALGRGRTAEPPSSPVVDADLVRLARTGDDLMTLFAANAELSGMTVERTPESQIEACMMAWLTELGAKSIVMGFSDAERSAAIEGRLREAGFDIVEWRGEGGLAAMFEVDVGITDVHAALAESGTLVCCADECHSRSLSLVPPAHLAVVRQRDILPDMIDYWAFAGSKSPEMRTSSISFITGPSKTADIEGKLITGVHGPGRVHILLVD